MSDSVRPHRWQPTRLPRPWDSPGKNTGVGRHFLLQCRKVKSESEVAEWCLTLVTPWTAAYQAPPSMGFSRQKYWSGVPLPSPLFISTTTFFCNTQPLPKFTHLYSCPLQICSVHHNPRNLFNNKNKDCKTSSFLKFFGRFP